MSIVEYRERLKVVRKKQKSLLAQYAELKQQRTQERDINGMSTKYHELFAQAVEVWYDITWLNHEIDSLKKAR